MKLKKMMFKLFSLVLFLSFVLPFHVYANDFEDVSNDLSITIDYAHGDEKVNDVTFSLYHVATMNSDLEFKWNETFKTFESMIDLGNLDSNEWSKTANTLASYIQSRRMMPVEIIQTDKNGKITFDDLSIGLYLVIGEKHSVNGNTYTIMPTLVSLPNRVNDGSWMNQVLIYPKFEKIGKATTLEVIKEWDEENDYSKRPDSIEVELLKDGQVIDVQTLSQSNNWRYRWENLETGHVYKATEKDVPEDYKVSISQEKTTIIITNRLDDVIDIPELEDTGVLWWPVPILMIIGILFVFIGIQVYRKEKVNER